MDWTVTTPPSIRDSHGLAEAAERPPCVYITRRARGPSGRCVGVQPDGRIPNIEKLPTKAAKRLGYGVGAVLVAEWEATTLVTEREATLVAE